MRKPEELRPDEAAQLQRLTVLGGRYYKACENFFTAAKIVIAGAGEAKLREVLSANPFEAKKKGGKKQLHGLNPRVWDAISEDVMLFAVRAQAQSHQRFRDLLISTGQ